MNHALILPLLVPLFVGALLLLCHRMGKPAANFSLAATWALVPIAIWLLLLADDGQLRVYALGNWQAPFGIILMLDRLSALMLLVTAVLAGFAVLYACRGDDERGRISMRSISSSCSASTVPSSPATCSTCSSSSRSC